MPADLPTSDEVRAIVREELARARAERAARLAAAVTKPARGSRE